MRPRTTGLREAWERALREHGARLVSLLWLLQEDTYEQRQEHWKRLAPGLKGIRWRLPDWPNVYGSQAVHEPDHRTLLELMNEEREHLRKFMDSWFAAGQHYAKWQSEYPDLARVLNEAGRYLRLGFQPTPEGGVQTQAVIEPPVAQRTLYGAAWVFANYFLCNPFREVLAGRCKRCQRYFFNRKGYEQMVFCGQKCRWDTHNTEKEISREHARQKQQVTALSAMRKFLRTIEANTLPRKIPDKSWKNPVVGEVNRKHGTKLEAKWLTRGINNPEGKYHKQFVRLQDAIEKTLRTRIRATAQSEPRRRG